MSQSPARVGRPDVARSTRLSRVPIRATRDRRWWRRTSPPGGGRLVVAEPSCLAQHRRRGRLPGGGVFLVVGEAAGAAGACSRSQEQAQLGRPRRHGARDRPDRPSGSRAPSYGIPLTRPPTATASSLVLAESNLAFPWLDVALTAPPRRGRLKDSSAATVYPSRHAEVVLQSEVPHQDSVDGVADRGRRGDRDEQQVGYARGNPASRRGGCIRKKPRATTILIARKAGAGHRVARVAIGARAAGPRSPPAPVGDPEPLRLRWSGADAPHPRNCSPAPSQRRRRPARCSSPPGPATGSSPPAP